MINFTKPTKREVATVFSRKKSDLTRFVDFYC